MNLFAQNDSNPPVAAIKPTKLEMHGDLRTDNYFWLRERENPEVISYLNSENAYTKNIMSDTADLQSTLFEEIKARVKETDQSAPYTFRGYTYYSRTEEGKQYSIYCRKEDKPEAEEQIMLDVNQLAEGHKFCSVAGVSVSAKSNILAFGVDFKGRRKYTLKFLDLDSGEMLKDEIKNITGNVAWAEDNKTIFYSLQDPQTLRWFQVYRHELGTEASEDKLVFEEQDEEFSCYVHQSRSREFILIQSEQTLSSEWRYVSSSDPTGEFKIVQPREADHEYSVDHLGEHFYIRTNWDAKNFRLMKTPIDATEKSNWSEVVAHEPEVFLDGFELFDDYLAVDQRSNGLTQINIYPEYGDDSKLVEIDEPVYQASVSATPDPSTPWLRYAYMSMTTPASVREYNVNTGETRLIKQQEVLGGFDRENYETRRLWAPANDGTRIPISIVFRKTTKLDGSAPCLLYGYGSYGANMDPGFSIARLNYLDRGFVYAIAHIRGGQEMGRHWYENGKLLKKRNTFTDFINAGEYLIHEKVADPKRLYGRGGSAGGLLIGAAINIKPDLFDGVIADVPFVDVVTTMLDDTIPLTTSEYDEWGNPNEKESYDYMLSYSPYDNVQKTNYPNILVTTGLHDSQVQYWEPAKWVAKLRVMKKDDNILLLKTDMTSGHGGSSGRYDRFKEVAFRQAFILKLAGVQ